jgi:hypothetical protein
MCENETIGSSPGAAPIDRAKVDRAKNGLADATLVLFRRPRVGGAGIAQYSGNRLWWRGLRARHRIGFCRS